MSIAKSDLDRFWMKVEKSNTCWVWAGRTDARGYGFFTYKGKELRAHRASWMFSTGDSIAGLVVCHKCDNPSCVRVSHLFVGTQKDNMRDCVAKGRLRPSRGDANGLRKHPEKAARGDNNGARLYPERLVRGERQHCAKLTAADVLNIRSLSVAGKLRSEIAKLFGVTWENINSIVSGKTWKHV